MKRILLICNLCLISMIALAGDPNVIESLKLMPTTSLPYFDGKGSPRHTNYFCIKESLAPIPISYYEDLGCTINREPEYQGADLVRKFEITHGKYSYLVALDVQESEFRHTYLASLDMYGNVIDYLSVGISFAGHNPISIKQFKVLDDMSVIVYSLNVQSSKPIYHYNKFDKVRAQRVDTYYKITDNGKFEKQREITYLSKDYTYAELDNMKNIKEGGEKR